MKYLTEFDSYPGGNGYFLLVERFLSTCYTYEKVEDDETNTTVINTNKLRLDFKRYSINLMGFDDDIFYFSVGINVIQIEV